MEYMYSAQEKLSKNHKAGQNCSTLYSAIHHKGATKVGYYVI